MDGRIERGRASATVSEQGLYKYITTVQKDPEDSSAQRLSLNFQNQSLFVLPRDAHLSGSKALVRQSKTWLSLAYVESSPR